MYPISKYKSLYHSQSNRLPAIRPTHHSQSSPLSMQNSDHSICSMRCSAWQPRRRGRSAARPHTPDIRDARGGRAAHTRLWSAKPLAAAGAASPTVKTCRCTRGRQASPFARHAVEHLRCSYVSCTKLPSGFVSISVTHASWHPRCSEDANLQDKYRTQESRCLVPTAISSHAPQSQNAGRPRTRS